VEPSTFPVRLGSTIEAVDAYAAGEPGRVIVGGVGDVPGASMFEKMVWLRENREAIPPRTAT
jgi:proline racemase